jgi:hypothetical protein
LSFTQPINIKGDAHMKVTKSVTLTTVGLGAIAAVLAYAAATTATAQTPAAATPPPAKAAPAAAPAPASSNIPRHIGVFAGGKVDAVTYAPSCPAFVIGMDAAAIQESNSRAFVEGEARKLDGLRDRWDAYEDCITENARRDIEVVRTVLGDTLSSAATAEATNFNAMNAAATANVERIGRLPAPKAPKASRNAPAAATPAAPPALSTWTPPTGRFIGSISGSAEALTYTTGCPDPTGAISVASFASESTRDGYSRLIEELRAMPDRINQVRTCRQENGQQDYELVQKAVTDGVNAVFIPRKTAFEREFAAIRFQLNEHRKPGGLLAPPEMGRPAARPASKSKAKKK